MSSYIPVDLRRRVLAESQGMCAYCCSQATLMGVTFEVDHIIPESLGGETNFGNLCLTCPPCNRHKSQRLTVQDLTSGERVRLFHPHKQLWHDHFIWQESGTVLMGLTAIGRATVDALQINRPVIVHLRGYWVQLGLHPP